MALFIEFGTQCIQQGSIFVRGAHGKTQAVLQHRMAAMQILDQDVARLQRGKQGRGIRNTRQNEVGVARKRLDAR